MKRDTASLTSSRRRCEKPGLWANRSSNPNKDTNFRGGYVHTFQNAPSGTGKARKNAPEILPAPALRPGNRRPDFSPRRNSAQTDFPLPCRFFSPLQALFRPSVQTLFRLSFLLIEN